MKPFIYIYTQMRTVVEKGWELYVFTLESLWEKYKTCIGVYRPHIMRDIAVLAYLRKSLKLR